MDHKTYLSNLETLESKYEQDRQMLMQTYASHTNIVKIGDIITDHVNSIKVSSIGYYLDLTNPSCRYYGVELTIKGVPKKNANRRYVYQCNLISVNGVPI